MSWELRIRGFLKMAHLTQKDNTQRDNINASAEAKKIVADIFHDFRNQLTTVLTAVDILRHFQEKMTPDQIDQHHKTINSHINNIAYLMDSFVLENQMDEGKLHLQPEKENIREFCESIIKELNGLHFTKSLVFTFSGPQEHIFFDRRLLQCILRNLLSNSIKYSQPTDPVYLHLSCKNNRISLSVRDRGIGIPKHEIPRIFERYYRCQNIKKIPGTGLGLSIVKDAIDFYGGFLEIESELNQGTHIKVILPLKTK